MSALTLRRGRLPGHAPLVDLRVNNDLIVDVAPHDRRSADIGEQVDLDGRWLLPGLWDHHVHVEQLALIQGRVDISSASSAAHAAALIAEHIHQVSPPPEDIVVGAGFRDGLWPDHPSTEMLRVGEHAVCLISADVHTVWSNRAAVDRLDLGEDGWWLREQPAFDLTRRLAELPGRQLDALVAAAMAAAASRGVVGLVDLEMRDAGAAWARRLAAGPGSVRVQASVYPHDLDAAVRRGQHTGVVVEETGGLLSGGPLKVFTDGSLNTRTAWCYDAYPGSGGHDHGLPTYDDAQLVALLQRGRGAGLVPTVHAIGDRAVTQALDALASVGGGGRIEHAQLVAAPDLPRFAELGVAANVQPEHAMDDRDVADHHWSGRTARAFPLRSLLEAGATLLLGSDAPVAPLDPWVTISSATARQRDQREPWHPEQRLSVTEALAASTRSSLDPGQPADLVVVDTDPYTVAPALLRHTPVSATIVAGRWTYLAL